MAALGTQGAGPRAGPKLGAQSLAQGLQGGVAPPAAAPAAAPVGVQPEDVMATLEKLGELKAKGILTDEEFATQKARILG